MSKCTGNYRIVDDINNFRVRIRWRFSDRLDWSERTFAWQHKVFSKRERAFYSKETNCITELERRFYEEITRTEQQEDSIVSTLIDGEDETKLLDPWGCDVVEETCDVMCIMGDLGIENDKILLALRYNRTRQILSIFPDFTGEEPYKLRLDSDRGFHYNIEHVSESIPEEIQIKEHELLCKVANHKTALCKPCELLRLPAGNKLEITCNFEILHGSDFENNCLCVKYVIGLPNDNWSIGPGVEMEDVTQFCFPGNFKDGSAHFGYCTEMVFSCDLSYFSSCSGIPSSPCVYLEVISKDSFDRYRCEGLTYCAIPIGKPGIYQYDLDCFRLVPDDLCTKLRRFFIGDASNYRDITWLGVPESHEGCTLNKFCTETVGTGTLAIRMNVLHQSRAFSTGPEEEFSPNSDIFDRINSSSLIKSVEEVLRAFRKARRDMKEAKKNL